MTNKISQYVSEIKTLISLAVPLMIVQLFNSGKGMVDTMMVGQIDKYSLAGISLAAGIYIVIMLFFAGIGTALIANLARSYSVKDFKQIINDSQQGLYLFLTVSVIPTLMFINNDFIFTDLALEPETKQIASDYLKVLGYVFPITVLLYTFRPILQTFNKNKEMMLISGSMFLLNIPLNYAFIYGFGPIEPMNAVGSAYATATCLVLEILGYYYCTKVDSRMDFCKNFSKVQLKKIRGIFLLGVPVGLAIVMEVGLFTSITFLLAEYGEETVGAHHLASNFLGFVFMFALGLNLALVRRVSYYIGLNDNQKIKEIVISSSILSIIVSIFSLAVTFIFKDHIIALYTSNDEVARIAVNILLISLIYQLFDGLQTTASGILRGYKMNRETFNIAFVCYWIIGLGSGMYLERFYGVYGYWLGLCICFIVASILSYVKVYKKVWGERAE